MRRKTLLALPAVAAAFLFTACGSEGIDLPGENDPEIQRGAQLFQQRCSGCHTLDVAGTQGSAVKANSREYKDGPNFNTRVETYDQILYAIRNGGFSSGPMPQNIVVGEDAEAVAKFLAKYAGSDVARAPDASNPAGSTGDSPVESPQTTPSGGDSGGSDPSTAQPGETPVGEDETPTPTPTP